MASASASALGLAPVGHQALEQPGGERPAHRFALEPALAAEARVPRR
jgi:hypothetical protein